MKKTKFYFYLNNRKEKSDYLFATEFSIEKALYRIILTSDIEVSDIEYAKDENNYIYSDFCLTFSYKHI